MECRSPVPSGACRLVGNANSSRAPCWAAVVSGETRAKGEGAESLPGFLRRAFLRLVSWLFCVLEGTPCGLWGAQRCRGNVAKPESPWKSLPISLPHHFKCGRADNNIFPKVQHWLPLSPLVVSEELGTLKDKTCLLLPAPTPAPQYLWILKTGPRVPFHITDPRGWRVQNPPTRSQEPSLSEERPPQAPVRLQCENGPSSLSTYSGFKLKTGKRELMNCKIRKNYQEK